MTNAAASGQPDTRYTRWIAHHYPQLLLACGASLAALDLGDTLLHLISPAVNFWGSTALFALVPFGLIAMHKHLSLLCPDCAAEVPDMDTPSALADAEPKLRLFHYLDTRRGITGLVMLYLGAMIAQIALGPFGFLATLLIWGLLAYECALVHRHRILVRWCPYCDWGGGGDPELSPEPDPDRSATR